ncbi:N-acetylgalactosamine-N,N'-diacetylbacillosaminyl-diphospho-undecaprenol 4-alpha-N-acetylgalactosaminyltransferase [Sporomusa ovata DSM 2662]|uniref:Alpha-1,4-N-acetylgalactosamine transferase PglJ n=1 Tax=Sporomusa ovata TaxID=2378 RepID=A0A0U1L5D5_9FIRM|nr:glycosyltransferase [Sporomusa ovata]EQB28391.1 glycosyltransferase [Sporomusa ovata DSM 2662]CQR74715.1 Alpha-1,4-N-acetylgalactosamine transferase PglJ [Sporomusa ovata]
MKKKILFFIPDLRYGGAEKVLVNLLNNLNRNKYQLYLLTLFDEGVNKQYLKKDVEYNYIFKKVFRGNSLLLKLFPPKFLYKLFIKEHYDILVAYLEGIPSRVFSGCDDKSIKKISWVHTEMINLNSFMRPYRSIQEGIDCYKKYDAIVGVSKTVIDSFGRGTRITKRLHVKYNTVETEQIRAKSVEPIDDIVFNKDIFNICSVGKLTEVKGFDRLLKIHNKLIVEGIKCHLYILGHGEIRARLEAYIRDNHLAASVTLLGFRDNPYKYVRNSDLFVCSSYREGFSTAVTEALIVGTPVITTLCSGMKEMLSNGKYGLIVDNSEVALYMGLKQLITDKDLLANYRALAIQRGSYFETKTTVQEVEKLFDEIQPQQPEFILENYPKGDLEHATTN